MLKKENAILIEDNIYYFKCLDCERLIKSKPNYLLKHSGKCMSCSHRKQPFEHIFKRFCNTSNQEKHENKLSYDQFLKFTKIDECHYCMQSIPWMEYAYHNNKYTRAGYFLDRKDNKLGYSIENCVVCCTRCNFAKGNRFSYEEWYGMTAYFRDKI